MIMTRLTLPPVLSASLPMSARQQSVPSNVITDMMTLREKTLTSLFAAQTLFSYKARVIVPMYWLISIYCEHCLDFNCINIILGCANVCSPTVHSLLCNSFVEIWIKRGGHRQGVLHLPQSNIGSAVSAQNYLLNKVTIQKQRGEKV